MEKPGTSKLVLAMVIVAVLTVLAVPVVSVRSNASEKATYGDLTQKEHCLHNLVLSLNDRDIGKYKQVLGDNFEETVGEKTITRDEDIAATKTMLEDATAIRVELTEGEWTPLATYSGEACDGCWATTREMTLKVVSARVGEAESSMKLRFIVVPVEESGVVKFKLRAMEAVE
jgi:hypothetical protein